MLNIGVEFDGIPGYVGPVDTSSRSRVALASAPTAVADGDYSECQVWQNASGSLDLKTDPQTCPPSWPSSSPRSPVPWSS